MSDIRLIENAALPAGVQGFDIGIKDNDLEVDDGLKTAVVVSLFTDARVTSEELPVEESDRRGWWSDAVDDDDIGSKLWLLRREKITPELLVRAREYCEASLQWLIDDGIADRVLAEVERTGLYSIAIMIEIKRPRADMPRRYDFAWRTM